MLRRFLWVTAVSFGAFVLGAILHYAVGALFGIKDLVFFTIAVFIAPPAFVVGVIGSVVLYVLKRRRTKQS